MRGARAYGAELQLLWSEQFTPGFRSRPRTKLCPVRDKVLYARTSLMGNRFCSLRRVLIPLHLQHAGHSTEKVHHLMRVDHESLPGEFEGGNECGETQLLIKAQLE